MNEPLDILSNMVYASSMMNTFKVGQRVRILNTPDVVAKLVNARVNEDVALVFKGEIVTILAAEESTDPRTAPIALLVSPVHPSLSGPKFAQWWIPASVVEPVEPGAVSTDSLKLGDVVRRADGRADEPFQESVVVQAEPSHIKLFRLFVHLGDFEYTGGVLHYAGDFEYTGGVLHYAGMDEHDVPRSNPTKWIVVSNIYHPRA